MTIGYECTTSEHLHVEGRRGAQHPAFNLSKIREEYEPQDIASLDHLYARTTMWWDATVWCTEHYHSFEQFASDVLLKAQKLKQAGLLDQVSSSCDPGMSTECDQVYRMSCNEANGISSLFLCDLFIYWLLIDWLRPQLKQRGPSFFENSWRQKHFKLAVKRTQTWRWMPNHHQTSDATRQKDQHHSSNSVLPNIRTEHFPSDILQLPCSNPVDQAALAFHAESVQKSQKLNYEISNRQVPWNGAAA